MYSMRKYTHTIVWFHLSFSFTIWLLHRICSTDTKRTLHYNLFFFRRVFFCLSFELCGSYNFFYSSSGALLQILMETSSNGLFHGCMGCVCVCVSFTWNMKTRACNVSIPQNLYRKTIWIFFYVCAMWYHNAVITQKTRIEKENEKNHFKTNGESLIYVCVLAALLNSLQLSGILANVYLGSSHTDMELMCTDRDFSHRT